MRRCIKTRRGGFLMEGMVALAVLISAAVVVAQLATWSLTQRLRSDARLEAVEAATNALELARAQPWSELNDEWASAQKPPAHLTSRWPDCQMTMRVEMEPKRQGVKRVTTEIKWSDPDRKAWPPITLTALFASRELEPKP